MPQNTINKIKAIFILLFIFWVTPSIADVPADHASLQQAIDAATNGDTITVA
ncbi:secreted protein, partial [Candidatus Magnetomorum sp. HK-1]